MRNTASYCGIACLIYLLSFSQVALAQSETQLRIVAPPGLETTDGNRSVPNNVSSNIIRVQELLRASYFSEVPPGGAWLVGLASRLDGAARAGVSATENLQLTISTSPKDTIGLSYEDNVGADAVQVFGGTNTTEFPISEGATNSFAPPLMFETPFFYDPAKGNLLTDFKLNGGSGNVLLDSHDVGSPIGVFGPINGSRAQTFVNDHIVSEYIFEVPEPSTFALSVLPVGMLLHCARIRSRRRFPSTV